MLNFWVTRMAGYVGMLVISVSLFQVEILFFSADDNPLVQFFFDEQDDRPPVISCELETQGTGFTA